MSEQVIDQNPTETASFDPFADHTYEQVGEPTLGQPHKRRRTSRVDTVLAQAKDVALAGIEQIAPKNTIGLLHHLRGEEDRLTTHLFECTLPGYRGWFWFATLARAPRSKVATVCEVGLLPGDDALLAPDWVPWAQRLQELPDTADIDEALAADPEDVYEDEEPQFDADTARQFWKMPFLHHWTRQSSSVPPLYAHTKHKEIIRLLDKFRITNGIL